MTATEDFIEIEGVRLRYKSGGSGPDVLLLHGWGSSAEGMSLVFDDLAPDYHVVSVDLPGHGQSGLPPSPWGVNDYAHCVLRFLDAVRLAKPAVVAHSFGGRIAIRIASQAPHRFDRMVLVAAAGIPPRRSARYHLRRAIGQAARFGAKYGGGLGRKLRDWVYPRISSRDYRNAGPLRETFVKVVSEDLTPLLPAIRARTLLVWGDLDTETPLASGHKMHSLIPESEMVVLRGAGHFCYLEQFPKFRLAMRKFLRS
jgi:pimeloyl-ACP methyl ester carboxylesterase